MLFVGIADHASKAMVSGCLVWATIGSVLLMVPITIVIFAYLKIKKLIREGKFLFKIYHVSHMDSASSVKKE